MFRKRFGGIRQGIEACSMRSLDFPLRSVLIRSRKLYGSLSIPASPADGRERTADATHFRNTRRLAALPAAAALAAAWSCSSGRDRPPPAPPAWSSHTCLVMTGSGDPAFVKNFNPYTATGLPSGAFVQGAFYEPLIVTGEGGLKPVPWLARSWNVEQRQQDADAPPRQERQVVRRQAADRRPTSSTASRPASRTRSWTASASPAPATTSPR